MKYRKIITGYWTDSVVEELSGDAKYVLLYLLTAPLGNLAGCYEISVARIAKDTELTRDAAAMALAEICSTNVASYSEVTNEVLIRNWPKYNWTKSNNLVNPVAESIGTVKDTNFKAQLADVYEEWFGIPCRYRSDTVSTPYQDGIDTVSVSVTDTGEDSQVGNQPGKDSQVGTRKHKHGAFSNVLLTDYELDKLKEKFPNDWESRIDDLSYYIGSTGKSYKSHYRTILSWERKNAAERKEVVADADKWAKYR